MKFNMIDDRPDGLSRLRRLIVERQSSILAGTVLVLLVSLFEIGPMFGFRFANFVARIPMPSFFDSMGARWVLVFFLFLFGIFAFALALKGLEQAEVTGWQSTEARITRSEPGFRLITPAKGMPRNHRIADIGYCFDVPSLTGERKRFGGSRVRIDEIIPEEEVEALLAKYPVGTRVTVYYDPANPGRNVLERAADGGRSLKGLAALAAVFAAIALPVMWFSTNGAMLMANGIKSVPLSRWGWVSLVFGLLALGFFLGERRQRRWLSGLNGWPKVTGVIVSSAVEAFDSGHRNHWNNGQVREFLTSYMPVIEYRYEVQGETHVSRSIEADTTIAGSEEFAERYVARYQPGQRVEVYYDPSDPARSALETSKGFGRTFLVAGTVFALVALFSAYRALV